MLIQTALNAEEVRIDNFWTNTRNQNISLIESMMDKRVVIYNGVFDWFHIVKAYNVLMEMKSNVMNPNNYWAIEARNPGKYCLKPSKIKDIMIHCQTGPYQYIMNRKPVYVKKVPIEYADHLVDIIQSGLDLPMEFNVKTKEREDETDWVDVQIGFKPSAKLDVIANDILGTGKVGISLKGLTKPEEKGWKPYGGGWIDVFDEWYDFWQENYEYAKVDVELLRDLDNFFEQPESTYNDELIACVANTRWKGFKVDLDILGEQRVEIKSKRRDLYMWDKSVVNINSAQQVLAWLHQGASDIEKEIIVSTNKKLMKKVAKMGNTKAKMLVEQRELIYDLKILDKLAIGRFHPSLKIVGAVSDRSSGADKFNIQGIKKSLRKCIVMADNDDEVADGGDFDAFEITITVASSGDKKLESDVRDGKKFTALLGSSIYDLDYEKIMHTQDEDQCWDCQGIDFEDCDTCSGTGKSKLYSDSKTATYQWLYGACNESIAQGLRIDLDSVQMGIEAFNSKYKGIGDRSNSILNDFTCLVCDEDSGHISFREPKKYAETLYGFRRYFDNEIKVVKFLYNLALNLPKELQSKDIVHRHKEQTISGCFMSALFGACFTISGSIIRAAGNHEIQGTGARITKGLQVRLWNLQPNGIHEFLVRLFNVHDEVQCVRKRSIRLKPTVEEYIEETKSVVPLIGMKFKEDTGVWTK